MNFKQWLTDYGKEYKRELKEWQNTTGIKSLIPHGLDEQLIQQYSAYRSELTTKRLVWATWTLAIATIILTIINLIIK